MRDLNSGASALLRAGKTAFRPTASDRERVLQSLAQRLGDGAIPDGSGQFGTRDGGLARHLPRLRLLIGGAAALALFVAGGAVVSRARSKALPRQTTVPAVVAPSAPPDAPPDRPASPQESEETAAPSSVERSIAGPRPGARSPGHPSGDSLAEEVRLLALAEEQWNSGHGEDALRTLREHERRFPKGALAEQRWTARVEVLCALGRFSSAKSELARLAKALPDSAPARARLEESVRTYCQDELAP